EADVLHVRPRRTRRGGDVRVEDGELVAVVLEKPALGLDLELEAVRARGRVAGREGALGHAAAERDQAAGFVRLPPPRVLLARGADRGRDHHQTASSIARSGSAASQNGAERYFQPASARTATTTPSSSSAASLRATWITAPEETPAKTPSSSRSARSPATAS